MTVVRADLREDEGLVAGGVELHQHLVEDGQLAADVHLMLG